jgi:WD40 repeat protein
MWSAELSDEVGGLSFSPDGKLVAVSHHRSTKNGDDLVIQLWNVATGKVVSALAVETGIKPGKSAGPVGFSKDGKYLAAISLEGQARVFALPTGREHLRLEHFPERDHANYKEPIATFAFASDGKTIATGSTRMVAIWDLESGKQRTILREETTLKAGVRAFLPVFADVLAFSPDGTMLAVGRLSGTVKLWDLKTQKVAFEVRGPGINAETLCYSPNGKLLAKAGRQGAGGLGVWELSTRKLVFASAGSGAVGSAGSGAKPAFFTPDGRYLVAIENVVFAVRTGGRAFGILIFDLGGLGPAKSG